MARPVTESAPIKQADGSYRFTERQRILIKHLANGQSASTATALAGYKSNITARKVVKDERIMREVKRLQRLSENKMVMSRKRVMDGFMEAIEQAKMLAEPMTQIAGWREIAKMCGYYAPEVKTLNVNVTSQRLLTQLETLSDKDLLELIEQDSEVIEGEARELLEHVPDRNYEPDPTASAAPA
jgi:phage terminase small subunit